MGGVFILTGEATVAGNVCVQDCGQLARQRVVHERRSDCEASEYKNIGLCGSCLIGPLTRPTCKTVV